MQILCHRSFVSVDCMCFDPFQNKTDKGKLPFEEEVPRVSSQI